MVHIEYPSKILVRTDEEQMDLLKKGLGLLAHLGEQSSCMVGCAAVNIIMFMHKASHSLQLGIEGLWAKDIARQGQCLEGNNRVLHVDALLALGKHKLEELHLNGPKKTLRAIEDGLPVAPKSCNGSADLGDFLVPPGKNLEGYIKNMIGLTEGQIALPQKHKLLDKGIPLADLARSSSRQLEEDGARHCEWNRKRFFY